MPHRGRRAVAYVGKGTVRFNRFLIKFYETGPGRIWFRVFAPSTKPPRSDDPRTGVAVFLPSLGNPLAACPVTGLRDAPPPHRCRL